MVILSPHDEIGFDFQNWVSEFKELVLFIRFMLSLNIHIAKFMGPTWGPSGSFRPQMGPMLVPWTLLSGHITSDGGHGDKKNDDSAQHLGPHLWTSTVGLLLWRFCGDPGLINPLLLGISGCDFENTILNLISIAAFWFTHYYDPRWMSRILMMMSRHWFR